MRGKRVELGGKLFEVKRRNSGFRKDIQIKTRGTIPERTTIIIILMKEIKIKFAGRVDNGGKNLSYLYISEDGKRMVFSKRVISWLPIGGMLSCKDEGEGVYSGFKEIQEKAEQEFIDEHIARDKAVYEVFRSKKEISKIPSNEYDNLIKRLKNITYVLSRAEKKALITKILLELL